MNYLKSFFLLLAFSPLNLFANEWSDKGWEKINEKEGITSYRKSFSGSEVKGVGGEAIINAPIEKILWVLMDNEHKNQWIDKFKDTYQVEELSSTNYIIYSAFDMPFPVSDREFLYNYQFSVDQSLKAVVVEVKSIIDQSKVKVEDGNIRGEIISGRYILTPKGDTTIIKAEYLADPKGSLPNWVVNMVQKNWPYHTISGLRKQVAKPFVKSWPIYEKELKKQLE